MSRDQISRQLGTAAMNPILLSKIEAIIDYAVAAERHRIYAALEADPGALWRDQGFQEWRRNREVS